MAGPGPRDIHLPTFSYLRHGNIGPIPIAPLTRIPAHIHLYSPVPNCVLLPRAVGANSGRRSQLSHDLLPCTRDPLPTPDNRTFHIFFITIRPSPPDDIAPIRFAGPRHHPMKHHPIPGPIVPVSPNLAPDWLRSLIAEGSVLPGVPTDPNAYCFVDSGPLWPAPEPVPLVYIFHIPQCPGGALLHLRPDASLLIYRPYGETLFSGPANSSEAALIVLALIP